MMRPMCRDSSSKPKPLHQVLSPFDRKSVDASVAANDDSWRSTFGGAVLRFETTVYPLRSFRLNRITSVATKTSAVFAPPVQNSGPCFIKSDVVCQTGPSEAATGRRGGGRRTTRSCRRTWLRRVFGELERCHHRRDSFRHLLGHFHVHGQDNHNGTHDASLST